MTTEHTEAKAIVFLDSRSPFYIEIGGVKYNLSVTLRSGGTHKDALILITEMAETISKVKGLGT